MIKAILFDFDGVLTIDKTGSTTITNYISKQTGIPLEQIKHHYYPYNERLLLGELTHEDMWPTFCEAIGIDIPYDVLIDSFKATALDQQLFSYILDLKATYQIGMVTDNKVDRMEIVLTHHHYKELFDVIAISAEQHSSKKDQKIFQYTLKNLGVNASECVFIDNTASNLIVPQSLGMATILFDDEHRNLDALKKELDLIIEQNK